MPWPVSIRPAGGEIPARFQNCISRLCVPELSPREVNVAPDWASMAILRGADLMFFRSRGADGEGTLADLVHQTAMYYEDRLGGRGFTRAILAGAGRAGAAAAPDLAALDIDAVRRQLEARLGTRVDMIDPRPAVTLTDRISASPALLDTLAPVVGLLLRERTA